MRYCPHCGRELTASPTAIVEASPQPLPGQTSLDPRDPLDAFLRIPAEEPEHEEDHGSNPIYDGTDERF